MIFLFEEFAYSEKFLQDVLPLEKKGGNWDLPKGFVTKSKSGEFVLDGVGYLYNKSAKGSANDSDDKIVFVLPKVFLEEGGKAFGKDVKGDANFALENAPKDFLANLSLWVCSTIAQYQKLHPNDRAIESPNVHRFGSDATAPTLIDVMNSMKLFYAENKNLFVFTAKNKHSGNNRIDWRRTVAHTQPFIQGESPIYMELVNKKKVFDLDDRLLVLYFSAMKFIQDEFGFEMPQSKFYVPLKRREFARLLECERGLRELRRIKYKYFEDRLLKLYNIMEAFFRWGARYTNKNVKAKEYLIANSFNNVFEAMIDSLISDQDEEVAKLKKNEDGKIIDHLYKEKSLIFADGSESIWHIGDSKYYKEENEVLGQSIAKQYTYAKNIVQDFFSPDFVDGNDECYSSGVHQGVRYRDSVTEGYSVTPNFFIRGFVPEYENDGQYDDPYFSKKGENTEPIKPSDENLWGKRNRHFRNRLFDRDTLLLKVYNINFLYVLKTYTSRHSSLRDDFKKKTRKRFRDDFLELLGDNYYFWAVYLPDWQKPDYAERLQDFVDRHFHALVGRVFQPAGTPHCLILALERDVVDKSKEGDKDDYRAIRKIVDDAKCEVFYVWPHEIWEDDDLRHDKYRGWNTDF